MSHLPLHYLNAVVAIGFRGKDGEFFPAASGFLLGKFLHKTEKKDKNVYRIYLVTNRHVLKDATEIAIRLNRAEGKPSQNYIVPRMDGQGMDRWQFHPDDEVDVAVMDMQSSAFDKDEIEFGLFQSDLTYLLREDMKEIGLAEGDFVYTIGFPMGLAGKERNYAIVRSGNIARIRDFLAGASKTILIDSPIYPGNSGGPVVFRPASFSVGKNKPIARAHLLGVVSGYIPYEDKAISQQTGMTRIIFQENSGLALVVPVQYIEETIDAYLKRMVPPSEGEAEDQPFPNNLVENKPG